MDAPEPPRPALSRWTIFRFAAAVWLTFGFVQVGQSYVLASAAGRPWALATSLVTGMPWWLSWLAFTPLIAVAAERWPFGRGREWRSLGAHVVASALVSAAHIFLTSSAYWLTTGHALGVATSWANQVQRWYGSFFLESMITYGAAAGAIIAIDFARGMRDEAVARARIEARAAGLESTLTKARLDALAMELNPHFLFNTLTAVSGLIGQDRRAEARDVIARLSELLRRTLGTGNGQYRSVAREVELLEDYLFIQRVRFSDRLHVRLDIADDTRECLVPSMLLQPLVENAIRHGVEPVEGRGEVTIQVARVSSSLRIVVSDSGTGFALDADGRLAREGIGLSNTRERLEHLYGGNATLVLQNARGGGAEAVVVVPAVRNGTHPERDGD